MNPRSRSEERDWSIFRGLRAEDPEAAERGRILTAQGMAVDTEGRKRVEDAYGVEYCRERYPEAYRHTGRDGIGKVLDTIRKRIPW